MLKRYKFTPDEEPEYSFEATPNGELVYYDDVKEELKRLKIRISELESQLMRPTFEAFGLG